MNKKFLLPVLILCIGTVLAIGYYAIFSTTFNVSPAITISENATQDLEEVFSGGLVEGEEIIIVNNAPSERIITLSVNTTCDIETSYASTVDMNKKNSSWDIEPYTTIVLSYTFTGENFWYKVNTSLVDYVVIYYPDLDDNPGAWNIENAKLIGDAKTEWTWSDIERLPNEEDWNDAAKLWLIPEVDWEVQSWNPTEWYFENNLVTYKGLIKIEANSNMNVIPLYYIVVGETGTCTVTTTVA